MSKAYYVAVRRDGRTFYLELTPQEMSYMAKLVQGPRGEKVAALSEALTTFVERAIAQGGRLERGHRPGAEIVGEVEAPGDVDMVEVHCPEGRRYRVEVPSEVKDRVCRRTFHMDDGTPCADVIIGVASDLREEKEGTGEFEGRTEPLYAVRYLPHEGGRP